MLKLTLKVCLRWLSSHAWRWIGLRWPHLRSIVHLLVVGILHTWHTEPAVIALHAALLVPLCKHNSIHSTFVANVRLVIIIFTTKAAHACTSSSTSTLSLCMSCQSVSSRKFTITLGANMRALSSMQLGVALQVMQSAEPHHTALTNKRLLLAVRQEMALKIVLASELGVTMWAFIDLLRRSRLVLLRESTHRKAHSASLLARIFRSSSVIAWKGERTASGLLLKVCCWISVWSRISSALPVIMAWKTGTARSRRSSVAVETSEAHHTCWALVFALVLNELRCVGDRKSLCYRVHGVIHCVDRCWSVLRLAHVGAISGYQ